MKGCPLRCSWCHNPEGLLPCRELMVSSAGCIHCGACKRICRHEKCVACGECVEVCPLHLRHIAGQEYSAEELAEEILKNSAYYARCGGGVTFSGGEPLMQAEFLSETLDRLPGIHRAIETSGFCSGESFRQIVEKLDYVIMDIKLFDREKHKRYVGADNEIILANAEYLCAGDKPFTVRIPMIPGVNDTRENLEQTASFLKGARALEKVELLPYHKTAGAKYAMVGREYSPDFDPDGEIFDGREIFEKYGIRSEML